MLIQASSLRERPVESCVRDQGKAIYEASEA
jgi:hypothetical protein